jgi:hypothetical protein
MVTTSQAAYSLGWTPVRFRKWASRAGVVSRASRWGGGPGRPEALWDLADIAEGLVRHPPGTPDPD